ncbi:MAG TPA: epoxyqueuosine reductase QueH [Candidatus Acutalibacter pullicola]|uniref:Epoxyqueuosine reductase QueH n=1 Tax=Candidatus Acutalibacter pullicola TaxID=2838417 RepID=A0A9D2SFH3_9FIRM|nr:epoxyqueuosine reductase QueH [Candidatus Acutalibacter pullicola]
MPGPNRNYAKELEYLIEKNQEQGRVPTLLLHACCAPCSSAVLEYLSRFFAITLLYYNPNIAPYEEYEKREAELRRLVREMDVVHPVQLLPCSYDGQAYCQAVEGLEGEPEGGKRCTACFRLRLEYTARQAAKLHFDYFTTTLSISPLKNARLLNQLGEEMGEKYGVAHLPSDFKKKDGYKRSVELSKVYGLYRQDYCGCVFSKAQRQREKEERKDA